MPIKIYSDDDIKSEIAWLCDDNWNLPDQINELESWLIANKSIISPGSYIADIGFSARKKTHGGGASLTSNFMKSLSEFGISLWLSEYPTAA